MNYIKKMYKILRKDENNYVNIEKNSIKSSQLYKFSHKFIWNSIKNALILMR